MSIFSRLTRVAKGRALLWSRGADSPRDPAVQAEVEAARPVPAEREVAPPLQAARRPTGPTRDPAEHPVARTDLLGDPTERDTDEQPSKRDLV